MIKKSSVIKILLISVLAISFLGFCACGQSNEEEYELKYDKQYQIATTGNLVELPKISFTKKDGTKVYADITVKNDDGNTIESVNNTFTPKKDGRYAVTYSTKQTNSILYYVYSFANGKEYDLSLSEEDKLSSIEWNEENYLTELTAISKVSGLETTADVKVTDCDGQKVDVLANRIIPQKLGEYKVVYSIGDSTVEYRVNCVWTKKPQIALASYIAPNYNKTAVLPIYNVYYPENEQVETSFKFYRENDESSIVPLKSYVFTADASRYYTLAITVNYTQNGEEKTTEEKFIIKRNYQKSIDSISATLEGNVVRWDDRVGLTYEGYYEVIGYGVSKDGGKTYTNLPKTQTSYVIESNKFSAIKVKEIREGDGSVAESDTLYYDGRLNGNILASLDDEYDNLVGIGSIADFEYNSTYEIKKEFGDCQGKEGVLSLSSKSYAGVTIHFGKTVKVTQDGILCIKLMYVPSSDFSSINISPWNERTTEKLLNLKNYGAKNNEWSNVFVPIKDISNLNGEYLQGIELYLMNAGGVFIDEILYFESEEEINQIIIDSTKQENTLITFENDLSSYYVSIGNCEEFKYNGTYLMEYDTVTENGEGYLALTERQSGGTYCGVDVKFPNAVEVNSRLKITLKVYSKTSWFTMGKYKGTTYGVDFGNRIKPNEFTTITLCPTELGYKVGDTLDGIALYGKLMSQNGEYSLKIAEITYYYEKDLSQSEYIQEDELANFNYVEYENYITSIDDGVSAKIHTEELFGVKGTLKINSENGAIVKISLPKSHCIDKDEYLSFNVYSTNNFDILCKGNVDDETANKVSVSAFAEWKYTSVKFTDLGYNDKDVISEIYLYIPSGGARKYVIIDEIKFGENLDTTKLIEFNSIACESLISRPSIKYNSGESGASEQNMYYASKNNLIPGVQVTFDTVIEDGNLVVSYNMYGSVRIQFAKSTVVTEKTKLVISINTDNTAVRLSKYLSNELGVDISNRLKKGVENIVEIYATTLGYQAGENLSGIDLYLGKNASGTTKIDYIDYKESAYDADYIHTNLEDNQVDNFYGDDYYDYISESGAKYHSQGDEVSNYSVYKSNQNIAFEESYSGAEGVMKVTCGEYTSLGVRFVKPLTLNDNKETKELTFSVKVYFASTNFSTFGALKISYLGYDGIILDKTKDVKTDTWTTVTFTAKDLGLTESGTVINGLDFYLGSYITVRFDEISFEYGEEQIQLVDLLKNNELSNFDDERYIDYVGLSGVKSATSNEYYTHGYYNTAKSIQGGALTIKSSSKYFASVGITLVKQLKVTDDLVINIKIKSGSGSLSVAKLGADSTGTEISGVVKGDWTIVSFYATDIGYSVDEVIKGLDLYFGANSGEYNYIDYIDYSIVNKYALNDKLTGNQVANFDDELYAQTVSNGMVADGVWSATSNYDWRVVTVLKNYVDKQYVYNTIPLSSTGKEGYVVIKIKTSAPRVRFYKGEATRADAPAGSKDLIHANSGGWVISSTGDWQTLIVPLTQIGYSEGDTFDKIAFAVWGNSAKVEIDYIEYVVLDAGITNQADAIKAYDALND